MARHRPPPNGFNAQIRAPNLSDFRAFEMTGADDQGHRAANDAQSRDGGDDGDGRAVEGGAETLVTQPATSSHYYVPRVERLKIGITDELIRLALGIEDPKDIIADLDQAFNQID